MREKDGGREAAGVREVEPELEAGPTLRRLYAILEEATR